MISHIPPSLWKVSFYGCCPQCGKASIFKGVYSRKDFCANCDLKFLDEDSADGPAYVAICLVGFMVTTLALFVEFFYSPPFWVHAVLWIPFVLIMSMVLLRLAKGLFIGMEYRWHIGTYKQQLKENDTKK